MRTYLVFLLFVVLGSNALAGEIHGLVKVSVKAEGSDQASTAANNANAVVFLDGFDEKPTESKPLPLKQQNKSFFPSVLVVVKDSSVSFPNLDDINHNVFSLSKVKTFDLGLYKAPGEKEVNFENAGVVKVFCNIHPQMVATILVLKNNKFFVTQEDGKFEIKNIPDGNYKLKVWADGAKLLSKEVTLPAASSADIVFEIQVAQQTSTHLNKFGKPYKDYN